MGFGAVGCGEVRDVVVRVGWEGEAGVREVHGEWAGGGGSSGTGQATASTRAPVGPTHKRKKREGERSDMADEVWGQATASTWAPVGPTHKKKTREGKSQTCKMSRVAPNAC